MLKSFCIGGVLALVSAGACAQQKFPPEQVQQGAEIYAVNCAVCHGEKMKNPPWAIDLQTFPKDERDRFMNSVTYGVRAMPPWGDVLKADQIAALWAYVVAGDK